MAFFETLVAALAAAILFLYGIEHLSVEIQRVAGERLRGLLAKVTANKWVGALIGAATTAVIQSSTATTVIAVGLVNSSIITFSQSLGIIAGANVGTTLTAQLVAFNLMGMGPALLIIGFILSVAGGKYKFLGKSIFYFGLVFFSLILISDALAPLKQNELLASYVTALDNPLVGLLFGIVITLVFQSSSVTTGMVVLLGMQGFITLGQAIPVVFGANIGTTSTAIILAYRLDAFAKRTSYAHLIFNILGVVMFLPFLPQFQSLVLAIGGDTGNMIANAHLIFNLTTAVVFLLLSERIAALLTNLIKTNRRELVFKTRYLNGTMPERTWDAIGLVRKEMRHELELVRELFSESVTMLKKGSSEGLQLAIKLEGLSDFLDDKISESLAHLSERKLSEKEALAISRLGRISNEIEQLADLGEDVSRIGQRLEEKGMTLMPESLVELESIESLFFENLSLLEKGMEKFSSSDLKKMKANGKRISVQIGRSYLAQLKLLMQKQSSDFAGTNFTDTMAVFETANHKIVSAMKQIGAIS